ncbi:MAG TPA: hypothetical protein VFI23_10375 [Rhizomicrobium sp.]|nr:hypothetical protein [Rhizomicrobium sp.]
MGARIFDTKPGMGASHWLALAAAPTFAAMAVVTAMSGTPPMLCSMGGSPAGGMVPMYLLMSLFHSAPWLKRFASGRRQA